MMKKKYFSPIIITIEADNKSMLCSSINISGVNKNIAKSTAIHSHSSTYSSLTKRQKLAAICLMIAFGGSCPYTPQTIEKINNIMSVEYGKMDISKAEVDAALNTFTGMRDMANVLMCANRNALEELFWAYYCIIAVGKSEQAVQLLLRIYKDFGFSEQEIVTIIENKTGNKLEL